MTNAELLLKTRNAKITYTGCNAADLFTKEFYESLHGSLERNITYGGGPGENGFMTCTIDGRFWTGTMWSRDSGVMLRELVNLGYIPHACLVLE
ncbi:MAG TPA: hypothetical protein PLZ84_04945, partial [Clostridia bacterium]|nr:hypothetical protein [Clostridia bacterium]